MLDRSKRMDIETEVEIKELDENDRIGLREILKNAFVFVSLTPRNTVR